MVRRKFVTSVSRTTTKTFGVYDPNADQQQQVQDVRVAPSTRTVQSGPPKRRLSDLLPRKKRRLPAENFADAIKKD